MSNWTVRISIPAIKGVEIIGQGMIAVEGDIGTVPQMVLEQLQTPGVDGLRLRDVHRQFVPLSFTTVTPFRTRSDAVKAINEAAQFKGPPVKVQFIIGDAVINYEDARVTNIVGNLRGPYFGANAPAGTTCSVAYNIILQRMVPPNE